MTILRVILLFAALLLSIPAGSDNPSPSAGKHAAPEQSQSDQSKQEGKPDQNSADKSPASIVVSPTINTQDHRDADGYGRNKKSSPDWVEVVGGLLTVIATAVVAVFTWRLSRSTTELWREAVNAGKTAKDTADGIKVVATAMSQNVEQLKQALATNKSIAAMQRKTAEMQFRAYVSPTGVFSLYAPIKDSDLFSWQFRVVWNNYGSAATRALSICTTSETRDTVLPANFNFPYDEGHVIKGVLLPHTPLNSAYLPRDRQITVEEIEEIQAGRKFLLVWGWAKYRDVWENTPQHITKFCWSIEIVGNPRTFEPNSPDPAKRMDFRFGMLPFGNCWDEECDE